MHLVEEMRPIVAVIVSLIGACFLFWSTLEAKKDYDCFQLTLVPAFQLMALCMDVRDNGVCFSRYGPLLLLAAKKSFLRVAYHQLET